MLMWQLIESDSAKGRHSFSSSNTKALIALSLIYDGAAINYVRTLPRSRRIENDFASTNKNNNAEQNAFVLLQEKHNKRVKYLTGVFFSHLFIFFSFLFIASCLSLPAFCRNTRIMRKC